MNTGTEPMKIYRGYKVSPGPCRVTVSEGGTTWNLDPRNDLRDHSPDGFNFGYEGSGPAQLALAMLAEHLQNDEEALRWYQYFKRALIARLNGDWQLTTDQIEAVMVHIRAGTE